MAKEKKSYEYSGHLFVDNGHGDLYNEEVDKFLIFRPYPMMVQTIMHKDGSITMNQEKFKENTDKNKGVYEEGYEINDDGSVFVKEEDVDKEIKEESENNKNTSEGQEVQNRFEKEVSTDIDSLAKRMLALDKKYSPYTGYTPSDEDMLDINLSHLQGDDESLSEVVAWYTNEIIANDEAPEEDKKEAQSIIDAIYDMGKGKTEEEHFAGEELYSDDPNRFGDKLKDYNEKMNPSTREYRFDFGFKDGSSLREDAFDDAKAYLEEEDMAQYLDEPLKSKVDSMKWVLDDVDKVHVEVKTNSPLSDEEMKQLKSEIEGQNSDGLGEGFEQQDFAESYYDPETGDGPYTRSEVMDIVQENYDNMDFWEYRDNIDYDDVREGLENYLHDGNYNYSFEDFLIENHDWSEEGYESEGDFREYLEQTPEGQLFEEYNDSYDAWVDSEEDDFLNSGYAEDYIDSTAIDNAKDMVARDDYRFNENLWDGGMTSMEWNIPDGVDVTPKSETVIEDVNKLHSNNFWDNDVQPGDKLNSSGAGEIEVLDLDKNSDYILVKRNSDYEPYVAAWAPDSRDGKLSWNQGHYFSTEEDAKNYFNEKAGRKTNDDLLNKVTKHYSNKLDDYTISEISLAFGDINDSHAFGVNKAVDKLLEYGEVVKVNAGNNGSNRVEVEVNNGQGKITFTDDGASLTGTLDAKQLSVYDEAIKEYENNRKSDVSFNFNRNSFEANVPKSEPVKDVNNLAEKMTRFGEKHNPYTYDYPSHDVALQDNLDLLSNNDLSDTISWYEQISTDKNISKEDKEIAKEIVSDLYKLANSPQEESERITKIEPRFTRIFSNRNEAYAAYQNGEITFEEYEEYIKKLARR